jgi:hypothetical protein
VLSLILIEAVWALVVYLAARWASLRPRPALIALMLASAAPTLIDGILGQVFGVEPSSPSNAPAWVVPALSVSFYASVVISSAVVVFAKGYRIPAAAFALPQIPLAWVVGFLGVMQVTGVWL